MDGLTEVLNYQQDMADELVQREPEKVKKLKRQKKELTDKCEEKEKQLEEMKKTLEEMKVAFESKETENKEIKEAMLELKSENIKLLSENSHLKARLEETENNLFKKDDENLNLKHEVEELKNKMQKDQTCVAQQASVICNQGATIEQMEVDADKKDLRIRELKQEMKEANTKVNKEVAEITVRDVIREAGHKFQILNLESKNVSLRSEIESLMQKTEWLEKLVTEMQDNAQKMAATAETKIEEMADQMQRTEKSLVYVNFAFADAQEHIVVTNQEKEAVSERLRERDQALNRQLNVNNQLRQDIDTRNDLIQKLGERVGGFVKILMGEPGANEGIIHKVDQMKGKIESIQEKVLKIEAKEKSFGKRMLGRFRKMK